MRSGLPLLLALLVSLASVRCDRPTPQPNVILIVVDTLRKDHLGVYGHTRPTSPNIDTLASSAVRYTRAFSQAPWTTPSVAALLTSLYPSHLDILHLPHRLSHDFELLPEVLQANGYATGAVISHDLLGSTWNFDQGYDEFYEELAQGHEFVSSPDVTDRAIDFVDRHSDRPFFLLAHYFDPHHIYQRHEGFDFVAPLNYQGQIPEGVTIRMLRAIDPDDIEEEDIRFLEALYDSDIAFTDHHIGRFLTHLRQRGLFDTALIVFTADHGEEFFDHRSFGHARTLYNELINVPLLVKYPDQREGLVSERSVGTIDVFPTVLDLLDIAPSSSLSGVSLLAQPQDEDERVIFSETSRLSILRAAIRGNNKLIADLKNDETLLFDLNVDPKEHQSLSGSGGGDESTLQEALSEWIASAEESQREPEEIELTEEEERRLRALGYIED